MPRFARLLLVVALLGAMVAVAPADPAGAFLTKTVTIAKNAPVEVKLGPIPGNYPGGTAATPEPLDCGDADNTAPFEAQCDTVPLKIVVPSDLGPTDDFIVTIAVSWDPNSDVKGQPADDIDIYLYDNTQIKKRKNPKSTSYTTLAESAGSTQPESIKLFSPDLGNYNLVVVNFAGPNFSYTVRATLKVEAFASPFEDLGPSFAPRTRSTGAQKDEVVVAPVDRSGDEPPSSGGGAGRVAPASSSPVGSSPLNDVGTILSGGRASLDEVPILPDADFSTPAGANNSLAAPPALARLGRTRLASAGPVSGVLLIFWLVLVPLALLGGGILWLIRRNRNAFSFA